MQLFGGMFGSTKKVEAKPKRPTVIPKPSFNLPIALLGLGSLELYEQWTGLGTFTALLGVFLTVQATRVK